jgi:uncharacterized protein YjbI with pentapeptide repeats
MAETSHLDLLRQDTIAWQQWRQEHPGVRPDLRGASLYREFLSEADLSKADLSGACLDDADLSQANLSDANLVQARLLGY